MKPYWSNEQHGLSIYLGDCLEIMPGLGREFVTLLWTDPPYGHSNMDGDLQAARVRDNVAGARKQECEPIANDGPDEMRTVVDAALLASIPLLRADCCCCCCCCCGGGGPKPTFAWTAQRMDDRGLDFFHAVVWDKSARGNGMGWRYRRNYEFVMVAHRTGGRLAWANEDVQVPNIVRLAPPRVRQHPNEKPVALVEHFAHLHTRKGHTVLDPFLGSGTTLVAAYRLGRQGVGIEISEEYCELAATRLEREIAQGRLFEPAETAQKPVQTTLECTDA